MKLYKNHFAVFILTGIISELFYFAFLIFNNQSIPLYMFTYFESFILFLFAYFFIRKVKFSKSQEAKIPIFIIAFAIVFRLTLIPTSYTTSDDVHRYLWEGKVLSNGFNPYTTPPQDSSLIHLRDDNYEMVTFKHIPAIYPPFSQVVFALNYLVSGNNVVFLKIIYLLFELVTLIFLLKILRLKGKDQKFILLYAWLPLPILEYFNNAHLDVIGITFLVMFLYYFEKNKISLSSLMLALAFLTKLLAILIIPLIFKKLGIKKSIIFYAVFLLVCLIFYLPFIYGNPDVLGGLFQYLRHWEFNGSVYNIFKLIFLRGDIARIICTVLLLISVLFISFKYKYFMNGVFSVLLCTIIFSATVYPWYLGWIAALNIFNPFYSILSLFFTINFSNFTPLAEKWKEYPVVLIIQYVPFYGLLVYDLWRRKKKDYT